MTTQEIACLMGVQMELVRDAAGSLYSRCGSRETFTFSEAMMIRMLLIQWGKVS
jgi:hypothetical protein